jgi:putative DNA primase/helicase
MPDDTVAEIRQLIDDLAAVPRAATIIVKQGERHRAADEGIAALVRADAPIYQRGAELVRVCLTPAKTSDGRTISVPGILSVPLPYLERMLATVAVWQRFDARRKAIVTIDPPSVVAKQILAMAGEWPFKPLAGVIVCPTLRPDGSLLDQPGYDDVTGLVLFQTLALDLPDKPTRDDAEAAMVTLDELLIEFPFEDDASRACALSMMITPVARGALPVAPMHYVVTPEAGTGKSYLADIASMIATGERCAVTSAAPNPEETEKRLIGAALAGRPLISLDNCSDLIRGDFLCQLIERPLLEVRPLGTSNKPRISNSFCVFANGNNVAVGDDMVRRAIRCGLDANMEAPETRCFVGNPLATVQADRARYVAAALTIVRAYLAAGSPDRRIPLASFEAWSDRVRSALIWLGTADPVSTIERARNADPIRRDRAAIFSAWGFEIGLDAPYQAAEIVALAEEQRSYDGSFARPTLRDALLAIAAKRGAAHQIDPRRLGMWLAKNEKVVAGNAKLMVNRDDARRPRWFLTPLT